MSIGIHQTPFFLKLNFTPLIKEFNLTGNYVLQHWQAKPFGSRHFGYLVVKNDKSEYLTIPSGNCEIKVVPKTLQVQERLHLGKIPTAVLYYPDSTIIKIEDKYCLEKMKS